MKRKRSNWDIEYIDLRTEKNEVLSFSAKLKNNYKKLLIIVLIIYFVVLFYGLLTTRFYKNDNGDLRAYRMSFLDFKTEDSYNALKENFTEIRILLRDITIIDIHLANGDYTNYEAATFYTKILNEQLDVLIPKVRAINVEDNEEDIKKAIESILSYDMALYLQTIIKGLQSGDTSTVRTALEYREKALETYEIIETELKSVAKSIKINDKKYFNWNLNSAVLQKDSTAILETNGGNNGK